ncbi:S-adenosyl-L-methionine-dependent methyltransferase [Venturia nashicola]|uniref:S-adenosyl-L-methionine-dependent methyltransferase n=1 Tax=Venturia nashicola TaxID=86259 RepID=A0A4Z1NWD5_9PEZI|nr:S-adenosyl-L-methionine-dependent methyltransferase [Venturia nashicola]
MSSDFNERVIPTSKMGDDSYASRMLRDQDESARLELQHHMMTKSLGYLLHPNISQQLASGCKIADVATGTAVFLRDLSEQLKDPSIELHGFDISADQFPPADQLAGNITLHLSNAKQGFPEEIHGKFDIVNLRLVSPAMENEKDWHDVARNSMALLKPGGYLQWIEGTLDQSSTVLCAVPGGDPEFSALLAEGMQKMGPWANAEKANSTMAWAGRNLAGVLKEVGAREVRQDNTSTDCIPEDRQANTRMFIGAFRTIAGAYVGTPKGFRSMDELREWHAQLQEMTRKEKVYMRFDIHTFVAKKAL